MMGVACRFSLVVSFHEEEGTFVSNFFRVIPLSLSLHCFFVRAFLAFTDE
jgi:hypothetical protein